MLGCVRYPIITYPMDGVQDRQYLNRIRARVDNIVEESLIEAGWRKGTFVIRGGGKKP